MKLIEIKELNANDQVEVIQLKALIETGPNEFQSKTQVIEIPEGERGSFKATINALIRNVNAARKQDLIDELEAEKARIQKELNDLRGGGSGPGNPNA